VVVVLDRRVETKRYGQAFLAALPPCGHWRGPAERLGPALAEFLAGRPVGRALVEVAPPVTVALSPGAPPPEPPPDWPPVWVDP
jgi:hypothetical protein